MQILSFSLFENSLFLEGVVDHVMALLPSTAEDGFTKSIIPSIKAIILARSEDEQEESYLSIKELATRRFAGYDRFITNQEVLERLVTHFIGPEGGCLKKREVRVLLKKIRRPVKRSKKRDRNSRISPEVIDRFTDDSFDKLDKEGIKKEDIEKEFKRIYEWVIPILGDSYHEESIRELKWMQPGVLFSQEEIAHLVRLV